MDLQRAAAIDILMRRGDPQQEFPASVKDAGAETRLTKYRAEVRKTFQSMSDQALSYQDARISPNPCIDRQEIDREIARRNRV